jgi:hypothetical protein
MLLSEIFKSVRTIFLPTGHLIVGRDAPAQANFSGINTSRVVNLDGGGRMIEGSAWSLK